MFGCVWFVIVAGSGEEQDVREDRRLFGGKVPLRRLPCPGQPRAGHAGGGGDGLAAHQAGAARRLGPAGLSFLYRQFLIRSLFVEFFSTAV